MKKLFFIAAGVFLINCQNQQKEAKQDLTESARIVKNEFQNMLDSAKVEGSILIFDQSENAFYSNSFDWAESGFLPASTFKIANSINALENGIVKNDSSILYWDGQPRRMKSWEGDMTFAEAYKRSCLPCYQEIARKTGKQRMHEILDKLAYPGMVFDSTNFDRFWVEGSSKITQFQQIDFLRRLEEKQLPIKENTYEVMNRIMQIDQPNTAYKLWGKTGWAVVGEENIGWFVGYVKKNENVYFLATNIQPGEGFDMDNFFTARMGVTIQALENVMNSK